MKTEYIEPTELKPYENNPREISKTAVSHVKESIKDYGFNNPILVDNDLVVIAGHTRLRAALELKLEKVPIIRITELTPDQVKKFRIVDNRVGEHTNWDMEKLLQEIHDLDVEMLPGFTEEQFNDMLYLNKWLDEDNTIEEITADEIKEELKETAPGTVVLKFEVPEEIAEHLESEILELIAKTLYGDNHDRKEG